MNSDFFFDPTVVNEGTTPLIQILAAEPNPENLPHPADSPRARSLKNPSIGEETTRGGKDVPDVLAGDEEEGSIPYKAPPASGAGRPRVKPPKFSETAVGKILRQRMESLSAAEREKLGLKNSEKISLDPSIFMRFAESFYFQRIQDQVKQAMLREQVDRNIAAGQSQEDAESHAQDYLDQHIEDIYNDTIKKVFSNKKEDVDLVDVDEIVAQALKSADYSLEGAPSTQLGTTELYSAPATTAKTPEGSNILKELGEYSDALEAFRIDEGGHVFSPIKAQPMQDIAHAINTVYNNNRYFLEQRDLHIEDLILPAYNAALEAAFNYDANKASFYTVVTNYLRNKVMAGDLSVAQKAKQEGKVVSLDAPNPSNADSDDRVTSFLEANELKALKPKDSLGGATGANDAALDSIYYKLDVPQVTNAIHSTIKSILDKYNLEELNHNTFTKLDYDDQKKVTSLLYFERMINYSSIDKAGEGKGNLVGENIEAIAKSLVAEGLFAFPFDKKLNRYKTVEDYPASKTFHQELIGAGDPTTGHQGRSRIGAQDYISEFLVDNDFLSEDEAKSLAGANDLAILFNKLRGSWYDTGFGYTSTGESNKEPRWVDRKTRDIAAREDLLKYVDSSLKKSNLPTSVSSDKWEQLSPEIRAKYYAADFLRNVVGNYSRPAEALAEYLHDNGIYLKTDISLEPEDIEAKESLKNLEKFKKDCLDKAAEVGKATESITDPKERRQNAYKFTMYKRWALRAEEAINRIDYVHVKQKEADELINILSKDPGIVWKATVDKFLQTDTSKPIEFKAEDVATPPLSKEVQEAMDMVNAGFSTAIKEATSRIATVWSLASGGNKDLLTQKEQLLAKLVEEREKALQEQSSKATPETPTNGTEEAPEEATSSGKTQSTEAVIADYDEKINEAKRAIADLQKEVTPEILKDKLQEPLVLLNVKFNLPLNAYTRKNKADDKLKDPYDVIPKLIHDLLERNQAASANRLEPALSIRQQPNTILFYLRDAFPDASGDIPLLSDITNMYKGYSREEEWETATTGKPTEVRDIERVRRNLPKPKPVLDFDKPVKEEPMVAIPTVSDWVPPLSKIGESNIWNQ